MTINRLYKFYNHYNLDNNKFKFIKPNNVTSITHITDSLSRDIQTNIINNIILNYNKYLKEYIFINLNLDFKNKNDDENIDIKIVNKIYNDILCNTCSITEYKSWIDKHKKLILPKFDVKISINDFDDGISNHYNIFYKSIYNYVNKNQKLNDLIFLNNDNKKSIHNEIVNYLMNKIDKINSKYNEWINENKINIINDFNSSNYIDIDKELEKNPYKFIPYMLFMNKNLELNNSSKKYQIIPLRTNLTPKFIPINIDSLVDILDSKYLLGKIKNYYHGDVKKGLTLFQTYFKFDSEYIKNTIKKGFEFSGLIHTNGYEINYVFYSKSYNEKKSIFHSKGKETKKKIKENTIGFSLKEKEDYLKKHKENKERINKEKLELTKKENNDKKQNEKNIRNNILKNIDLELLKIKKNYDDNLKKIEEEHYKNLKLEFDKIDKTKNNKKIMNEIIDKLNDIFVSNNVYLKHEYDRNYLTLLNDYSNTIDIKYEQIKKKETENNNLIKNEEKEIFKLKNELKKMKKEKFGEINKVYKKETKPINSNINNNKKNKKILNRLINKIRKKTELLNYELTDNKSLTINHIIRIIETIINLILKMKSMEISKCLNEYLDSFTNIQNYFFQCTTKELQQIINLCLKYISIDVSKNNNKIDMINLFTHRLNKIKKIEIEKNAEYKKLYTEIILKINNHSLNLNKLLNEKRKIEKEKMNLFKQKPNEITKVDNMSKKTLSILDKMNWVVIDPGVNSLLTMMSKDNKTKMSYSKCQYLNKIKRKEIIKKIEKIKKEKIKKIENKLTIEKSRLRASNEYKKFNEYFNLKMEIHNELSKLYNDIRLNKLKWYSFINNKRSENKLINDIRKKFGNDVVLIMGDWSMNKKGIKSISVPNKKYEKLLSKNFPILKIDEFRTSIIENKTKLKCENLIKKMDYDVKCQDYNPSILEKMNIVNIYSLEKLKEKNEKKYKKIKLNNKIHKILTCKTSEKCVKYINRDTNAVKNMRSIVSSYIKTNKKPKIFVLGTKISNDVQNII